MTVSGRSATAAAAAVNRPAITTKEKTGAGPGASCTAAPEASAPIAMPPGGAPLVIAPGSPGRDGGASSTTNAPSALSASPTESPCTARPAMRGAAESTVARIRHATTPMRSAGTATRFRPRWSDRLPQHSNAASSGRM